MSIRIRWFVLLTLAVGLTVVLSACGTNTDATTPLLTPQIANGNADNGVHPYVGLMVALDDSGNPLWRCSGTLLTPTVFLTAGHCTDGVHRATIWFEGNVDANMPSNGYPFEGEASGNTHTYPAFDPNAFYLHDVGVVVLDEPYGGVDQFGSLPQPGALDTYARARGLQDATLTAVGYGLQHINASGKRLQDDRVRLNAVLDIVDLKGTAGIPAGTSVMVSGNHHTGGTCFGDSGGPMFLQVGDGTTVAAVTSFGLNGNCAGVGGGFRIDQPDVLAWLATFMEPAN